MPQRKRPSTQSSDQMRFIRLVITVLVIAAVLYYIKGWFFAAVVNGQPVSRLAVVNQLEKTGGKQTLDSLINQSLILQEAKKLKITVSNKEVDDEIKRIKNK